MPSMNNMGKVTSALSCHLVHQVIILTASFVLCRISFSDPVAVRHSLAIISDLATMDPYSVAMALGLYMFFAHVGPVIYIFFSFLLI